MVAIINKSQIGGHRVGSMLIIDEGITNIMRKIKYNLMASTINYN